MNNAQNIYIYTPQVLGIVLPIAKNVANHIDMKGLRFLMPA
jgi:hypothetical protein